MPVSGEAGAAPPAERLPAFRALALLNVAD
jgi:hypothetical protein